MLCATAIVEMMLTEIQQIAKGLLTAAVLFTIHLRASKKRSVNM